MRACFSTGAPRKKLCGRWAASLVRAVVLSAALALASYLASWLCFGTLSYAGQRADWLVELVSQHLWVFLEQQLEILALYSVIYLGLMVLAEGVIRGLEVLRGRRLGRRWLWRAGLAVTFNLLVMAQTMALYPALFDEHFYRMGGVRRVVQELAVGLGPYWLVPLYLGLVGHAIDLRERLRLGTLIAVVTFAVLAGVGLGVLTRRHSSTRLAASPKPNLLILACDSLRGDRITRDTTPTLASLGRRGVFVPELRISLARTTSAWTGLLTGRWPIEHGIRHMFPTQAEVAAPFPSIIRSFAGSGYRTLVVGDLGSEHFADMDFGFAERDVPRWDIKSLLAGRFVMTQPLLLGYLAMPLDDPLFAALRLEPSLNDAGQVTGRLLDRLDQQAPGMPFAAVAIYAGTHFPYAPPYPYDQGLPPTDRADRFSEKELSADAPVDAEQVARTRALYDATARMFDDEVAHVLDYLARRQLLANTVVMVIGDHGEELYDDGETLAHGDHLLGKSNRTALIVHGPGVVALDAPVRARLRDVDLAATLSELFGLPPWDRGESFAPLLTRGSAPADRDMYYETGIWLEQAITPSWQRQRMAYPDLTATCHIDDAGRIALRPEYHDIVVSAKHRSLETADGEIVYMPTLYGPRWTFLPPGERRDPTDDPAYRAAVRRLRQQLETFTTSLGERWIARRVLPAHERDEREATDEWSCRLEVHHDADALRPGRYQGALTFAEPVPFGAESGERTRATIDIVLDPGETYELAFRPPDGLVDLGLDVRLDGMPLGAVDLFAGSLNLQPWHSLEAIDLEAYDGAVTDSGGFREPTTLWLGCQSSPSYLPLSSH